MDDNELSSASRLVLTNQQTDQQTNKQKDKQNFQYNCVTATNNAYYAHNCIQITENDLKDTLTSDIATCFKTKTVNSATVYEPTNALGT